MQATTQSGIRNVLAPGERKVRQRLDHLKYPTLKGRFYSDTSFANVKSLRSFRTAQHFTNGLGYERFYPTLSKGHGPTALMDCIQDVGIPATLVTDGAAEETKGEWAETCKVYHIQRKETVPYSPWQNLAEASVRAIKQGIRRATTRTKSPKRLWCYCGQWVAAIRRLTALDLPQLEGQVPEAYVSGSTVDISSYAQFDWYEYVWYSEPKASFPNVKKCLGRWIGIAEVSTDIMASYILTDTGKVIVRKSVWGISPEDLEKEGLQSQKNELDEKIKLHIGDQIEAENVKVRKRGGEPKPLYTPPSAGDL